jgi:hypothetical protein
MISARRALIASIVAVAAALPPGCGNARSIRSQTGVGSAGHSDSSSARAATSSTGTMTVASMTAGGKRPAATLAVSASTAPVNRFPGTLTSRWQTISKIKGEPAMWIAQRAGVTLVRMDQRFVHLALHAGSLDPGGAGWHYGDVVAGHEIHHLVLGFNGGFRFSTGAGGFFSLGRTAVPLTNGLGSVVTYRDGRTDIGGWGQGVPVRGHAIASVRQNLHLLIDHGQPDGSVTSCGEACWGATIGGLSSVARSGLGIRSDGQLLWAAGEGLSVGQLAGAMVGAGVQRAIQLDINPDWVAGYLYVHHRASGPTPVPVVPGQYGLSGQLLLPYSRDFFTVLSN